MSIKRSSDFRWLLFYNIYTYSFLVSTITCLVIVIIKSHLRVFVSRFNVFFFKYFILKLNFQTRLSLSWRKGTSASALVEYQLNNWLPYAQFIHAYASKELWTYTVNNTIVKMLPKLLMSNCLFSRYVHVRIDKDDRTGWQQWSCVSLSVIYCNIIWEYIIQRRARGKQSGSKRPE